MHQKLTYRLRPFVAASLAGFIGLGMLVIAGRMAVADAPAQDVVQISDTPLGIMADQNKPNVMLLLDTSDSMKWTHMPDDWEQDATTYFPVGYKSALCNTLYYNPQTTYVLPKRPDGRDMDTPAFENAWKDGYDQSLGMVDLSEKFQAYDNDTRRRALYEDPAQPAYFFEWLNYYAAGRMPEPHFEEPSENIGVCNKISSSNWNFNSARVDDGTLRVDQRSPNIYGGGGPDGWWTRRAIPAAQRQNFANWYSYYRTRINMAKSSVSLAFSTLNDNFRIGFLTVANPGVGPHSKFLPVADFNTEGKQQWLEAIQTVKTGGTSPAREALARVGRYYAGQSDSINASMTPFVDPVVSACQRHYAIVTTDGYWNIGQESAGPVKLDGQTLVGQQDGPPASLTDADGLRPRPIFDGSVGGTKDVHDASVSYKLAQCELGWKVTTPGGGTKTETTYKKIVKKDVLKKQWSTATLQWAKKSTNTLREHFGKISNKEEELLWPKRVRSYWNSQRKDTVTRKLYRQLLTWDYVTKTQYRFRSTTTWSTETQTPWASALAIQTRQKRYFYWYKNPAVGEQDLKTTDKNVCNQFAGGCRLEGSDQWSVVQSCSAGADGFFKVECETVPIQVSAKDFCGRNGQYVQGLGLIKCDGTWVAPYSGPVASCGAIHPDLQREILAASQGHGGNPLSMVQFSNCNRGHKEEKFVTADECKQVSPSKDNGFRTTSCVKVSAGSATDNSCQITTTPVLDASSNNLYSECTKSSGQQWTAFCTPGPIADTSVRMNTQCGSRGDPVSVATVPPNSCKPGANADGYFYECTPLPSTWSGPVAPGYYSCRTDASGGLSCEQRASEWRPAQTCRAEAPSASNGWIGRECKNKGEVPDPPSCKPAPGKEGIVPPAGGPRAPGTCTPQAATAENGCIVSWCTVDASDPIDVAANQCTSSAASATNNWTQTICTSVSEPGRSVPSCSESMIGFKSVSGCRGNSETTDMAFGSCESSLLGLDGGGNPTQANGWTTSSCSKVDEGAGGLSYLQSEADFAACEAGKGTAGNGVEIQCVKDGPHTVAVLQGEGCVPGYNASTKKVTDCAGVGQPTSEIVADKPANCPAAPCEKVFGRKKIYEGRYWSDKKAMTGTIETGTVSTGRRIDFSGDLESPARCYAPEEWVALEPLEQPPNGRPQPGTPPWTQLPATHTGCGKLPCEELNMQDAQGGSTNSLADVAQYYYATDLRPDSDNVVKPAGSGAEDDKATWQHMSTYVIGMGVSGTLKYDKNYKNGAGDFADLRTGKKTWPIWPTEGTSNYEQRQSIDDFWHTAVNGRGLYFSANDPKAIEAGLSEVFTDIRAVMGSGAGVAVSSALVDADSNYAYGATYKTGRWSGDLLAYRIDPQSGQRTQIDGWSARARLDARDQANDPRTIYFMDGKTRKPFTWSGLDSLQSHFSGTNASSRLAQYDQMSQAQQQEALGQNLVNFIRGDQSKEGFTKDHNSKLYRTRESRLGDIIGSQPLYVGEPLRKYRDAGHSAFRLAQRGRTPMVYVGGNDGMLHAFYAEVDPTASGTEGRKLVQTAAREAWAFVPTTVMPELPRLASTSYEGGHRYFVDGSAVMADIQAGGTWKTILVGGFNKGGKGYYALDITHPQDPKPLWEVNSTTISTMGHSFGRPLVSKLPDGRWAVFLTSGYNNIDNKGYLYVLDANDGSIIHTIGTAGSGLREINNYVRNPTIDNTTQLLYGGDLEGNIWRFEFKKDGSAIGAKKVVQLVDESSNPQPITTRIELVPTSAATERPRILVGTGRLYGSSDLADKSTQSVYGFDDNMDSTSGESLRSRLNQMLLEPSTGAGGQRTRTIKCLGNSTDCKDDAKGWYVDLPDSGERVNFDMRLANSTLVIASNVPSPDVCLAGGYGWINYLDFNTGQAVTQGPDGKGDVSTMVDGSTISGHATTITGDGKATDHISTTGNRDKPLDIDIPYGAPKPLGRRISWRELVK
ncbi:PilC/PilY family type IV pilus protein [Comamonas sp.]|uniref:pilus assembly protein n=1 Tax=Comamonas sp. TaxID=34028 RepID=UPI0025C19C17|nr:PilC/PilY family type IV pilus protein [Comamonas sp.]